jgi:hypothetical protein
VGKIPIVSSGKAYHLEGKIANTDQKLGGMWRIFGR